MKNESWFYKAWRPSVAWGYLFLCIFDFFLAPVLLTIYCYYTNTPYIPWDPITTKGGSVLHASLGGISGISAWSRGKEKIANIDKDRRHDEDCKDDTHGSK